MADSKNARRRRFKEQPSGEKRESEIKATPLYPAENGEPWHRFLKNMCHNAARVALPTLDTLFYSRPHGVIVPVSVISPNSSSLTSRLTLGYS